MSGSVLGGQVAVVQLKDDGRREAGDLLIESHDAAMGRLMVGKEWWVSDNWGMGVAASLFGGVGVGEDAQDDQRDLAFGGGSLLLTSTFN